MELMQLEMFVAMVEEGSFHKAAERVFRTQPAVSIAIRKLEQELGCQLFDRANRNACVLTDTGEVLYGFAKQLLNLRTRLPSRHGGNRDSEALGEVLLLRKPRPDAPFPDFVGGHGGTSFSGGVIGRASPASSALVALYC